MISTLHFQMKMVETRTCERVRVLGLREKTYELLCGRASHSYGGVGPMGDIIEVASNQNDHRVSFLEGNEGHSVVRRPVFKSLHLKISHIVSPR